VVKKKAQSDGQPGNIDWANFLDQELGRRETRQYFVWSAAIAISGLSFYIVYGAWATPLTARQLAAVISTGAVVYWIILRKVAQRFMDSAIPDFLPRIFNPVHSMVIIRYLRRIGVPASQRVQHALEAIAALSVLTAMGIFIGLLTSIAWFIWAGAAIICVWAAWHLFFVILDGESMSRIVSTSIRMHLRMPGVRHSLGFTDAIMHELRGGKPARLQDLPMEDKQVAEAAYRIMGVVNRVAFVLFLIGVSWLIIDRADQFATAVGFAGVTQMMPLTAAFALAFAGVQLLLYLAFDRTRMRLEALRIEAFTRFPGHDTMDQGLRILELLRSSNMHDQHHPFNLRDALLADWPPPEPSAEKQDIARQG
jgi:hypothetical protein